MSPRTPTLFVAGASVAMVVALVGLGAAAVGHVGLRLPSLLLLAVSVRSLAVALLQRRQWRESLDHEARAHLERAGAELAAGNAAAATSAAAKAFAAARTTATRNQALHRLAWAAMGQGYPERAKAALDEVEPAYAIDVGCLAAVEAARGRAKFALQVLEVARATGSLGCDGAKLLVDCTLRVFGIDRATLATVQLRKVLGRENCERVLNAARLAGAQGAAGLLAEAMRAEFGEETPSAEARILSSAPGR